MQLKPCKSTLPRFQDESTDIETSSSEDDPSSGYQTSQALSPLSSSPCLSSLQMSCPGTCLVLHCSDQPRNGLLILPLVANVAITSGKQPDKHVASLDVNEAKYYVGGQSYQVVKAQLKNHFSNLCIR